MAIREREYLDDEVGDSSVMSIRYDISNGMIHARATGLWSLRQTKAFLNDWTQIVGSIHSQGGFASVLVDMSESTVQKIEIAKLFVDATQSLYRDGDAIAMLVPSSLAKAQMRRVLDGKFHGFFISKTAAVTWLNGRSTLAGTVPLALS